MAAQHCGAFIETTRVPGVSKSELVEIQMVIELGTERAQRRQEGGDFLAHHCSDPHSNQHGDGIVAKKFGSRASAGIRSHCA